MRYYPMTIERAELKFGWQPGDVEVELPEEETAFSLDANDVSFEQIAGQTVPIFESHAAFVAFAKKGGGLSGGNWVTTKGGRHLLIQGGQIKAGLGKQAGVGPLAGGAEGGGAGVVLAERNNSPEAMEAAVRKSQKDEGAGNLDIRVESGPPQTAKERKFAEKANAQGKAAVHAERAPQVRTETSGDQTEHFVGGIPRGGSRPATAADRGKVGVADEHGWVSYEHDVKFDNRTGKHTSVGQKHLESHPTREAAERAAAKDARSHAEWVTGVESDLIAVKNVETFNWANAAHPDAEYTTTFRLILAGDQ